MLGTKRTLNATFQPTVIRDAPKKKETLKVLPKHIAKKNHIRPLSTIDTKGILIDIYSEASLSEIRMSIRQ